MDFIERQCRGCDKSVRFEPNVEPPSTWQCPLCMTLNEAEAAPQTPDEAAEAGNPFTPEQQRKHDELMARTTEAIYVNAVTISKVTLIPATMIPRLIVCGAVFGIQKQIEHYQRREDHHNTIPFRHEERHALQQRIIEDCTELQDAMTEAINNLKATVASMKPMPTLVQ